MHNPLLFAQNDTIPGFAGAPVRPYFFSDRRQRMDNLFSSLTVSEIIGIVETPLPAGYRFDYRRPAPCLIITFKGSISYYYNGVRYIADANHPLFIPEGAEYYLIVDETSNSIVMRFKSAAPYRSDVIRRCTGSFATQAIHAKNLWTFQKPSCQFQCMSIIYEILSAFEPRTEENPRLALRYNIIQPSMEYLEQNYTDRNLSNRRLAEISGVSAVYFRKLFTESFGVSPMRYIRALRIETAKNLLRTYPSLPISQVAEMVGYDSIYYFSRVFKQETLLSPSEYARHFHAQ